MLYRMNSGMNANAFQNKRKFSNAKKFHENSNERKSAK